MPILPPAVIRSLRLCVKRLNMSIEQYRDFYFDNIEPDLISVHVFGIDKSLDIICAYLENDDEKANKMIANGKEIFIKEYSSKRR